MGTCWGKVTRKKDYKFWAAVASSLRMGCLGLRDKSREMQAIRISLAPFIMGIAARQGDIPLLDECIQAGGDAYSVDYDGRTPLHIAASEPDIWTVRYLISKGADINARDRYNETPLKVAMRDKNIEIVKLLYQEGSRDGTDPVELGAELCNTAFMNDTKQMEAWLAGGISCNSVDYDSRTPLHVAVSSNRAEMVEFLLNNGANTDLKDRWNRTPFDNARRKGYQNIEKMLLTNIKSVKRQMDDVQKSLSLDVHFGKRIPSQMDEERKLLPLEKEFGKQKPKQTDEARKPLPPKDQFGTQKPKQTDEARKPLLPKEQFGTQKPKQTAEAQKPLPPKEQFDKEKLKQADETQKPLPPKEQFSTQKPLQTDEAQVPLPPKEQVSNPKLTQTEEAWKPLPPKEQVGMPIPKRPHIIMVKPSLIQRDLDEQEQQSLMGRFQASPALLQEPRKQDSKEQMPKKQESKEQGLGYTLRPQRDLSRDTSEVNVAHLKNVNI